jgi:CRP-like cAMP-binding protein
MFFNSYHQLNKNDFLYKKGEQNGQGFYYLVEGKIELLVKSEGDDEFKFSKSIDKGEFFGFRQTSYMDPRTDYAKISSEKAIILELNVLKYLECISKTQMSEGEKKIDFLVRYVPKFRNLP